MYISIYIFICTLGWVAVTPFFGHLAFKLMLSPAREYMFARHCKHAFSCRREHHFPLWLIVVCSKWCSRLGESTAFNSDLGHLVFNMMLSSRREHTFLFVIKENHAFLRVRALPPPSPSRGVPAKGSERQCEHYRRRLYYVILLEQ